jgi:hypothetical protein
MFENEKEKKKKWDVEISDDVIEEWKKNGGVINVYVEKE